MAKGMQAIFDGLGMMDVYAIAVDDVGVAASVTLTVAGTASESRVLYLYIGGELVQVTVSSGDTEEVIAGYIKAVLDTEPDLPVVATC